MLKMDGFDDCIAGVISGPGIEGEILCYDRAKVIDKIAEDHECTFLEAKEYHEFNQAEAYVGPGTPVFLDPYEEDD